MPNVGGGELLWCAAHVSYQYGAMPLRFVQWLLLEVLMDEMNVQPQVWSTARDLQRHERAASVQYRYDFHPPTIVSTAARKGRTSQIRPL